MSTTTLYAELIQQPQALRDLVACYQQDPSLLHLPGANGSHPWVLTGMGASYHAAWIGSLHLNQSGILAVAVEATDLVNYAAALREGAGPLIYISQSGSSGEVFALLDCLPERAPLVAMTNQPDSPLGKRAARVLPLSAGDESWIASKTYLNSLALLWLLARCQAGQELAGGFTSLLDLAGRAEDILTRPEQAIVPLLSIFDRQRPLLFIGHGPHAVTARQSAMTLGEWPKVVSVHNGVGAFRHGFIETVEQECGVVAFAPPGRTVDSTRALAAEIGGYGARVLLVENGRLRGLDETPAAETGLDEFLSPLLDILPVQLFADALAHSANLPTGFRYISKVVKQT